MIWFKIRSVYRCSQRLITQMRLTKGVFMYIVGVRGFSRLFEVYVSDCVTSLRRTLDKYFIQSKDWPHSNGNFRKSIQACWTLLEQISLSSYLSSFLSQFCMALVLVELGKNCKNVYTSSVHVWSRYQEAVIQLKNISSNSSFSPTFPWNWLVPCGFEIMMYSLFFHWIAQKTVIWFSDFNLQQIKVFFFLFTS